MAFLTGAISVLTLSGTPGAFPYLPPGSTYPRPTGLEFTDLALNGTFFQKYSTFSKTVGSTAFLSVTDTASISAAEDPISQQEIFTQDDARISVTDVSALLNRYTVSDTASITLGESIGLLQSGVTDFPVTDTASISVSEVTAVYATLDVTDTASISAADVSSLAYPLEIITSAGDTASITASSEVTTVNIFAGSSPVSVNDTARLSASEVSVVVATTVAPTPRRRKVIVHRRH